MGLIHRFFEKFVYNRDTNPLPLGILFTISFSILFDAVTEFSGFAYFPQLIKSFGVSEVETGKYAGPLGSMIFISRAIACPVWGHLADVYGKKRCCMIALFGAAVSTCLFSFVTSYTYSLVCRTLQGTFMCMVVIGKSMVNQISDKTNRAFVWPFISTAFTMGALIGPSIGGFTAFPVIQYPNVFPKGGFFEQFPAYLPNIIITVGLTCSFVLVTLLLPSNEFWETDLKSKTVNKDTKRKKYTKENTCIEEIPLVCPKENEKSPVLSHKRQTLCASYEEPGIPPSEPLPKQKKTPSVLHQKKEKLSVLLQKNEAFEENETSHLPTEQNETSSVLSGQNERSSALLEQIQDSKVVQVLRSPGYLVVVVVFFFHAIMVNGYYDVFPVYLTTAKQYNGLEMTLSDMALIAVLSEPPRTVFALVLMGKVLSRCGSKKMIVASLFLCGLSIGIYPAIGLVKNRSLMWLLIIVNRMVTGIGLTASIASISSAINTAVPAEYHGLAHGLSISIASVGRAIGPTMMGVLYSWGMTNVKTVEGQKERLGFPFNQFFPFLVGMMILLSVTAFAHFALKTDKRTDEDEGTIPAKEI